MIPIRFYLFAGLAAFIAFALWHDHHTSRLLKAEKARTSSLNATLVNERHNREIEQADRRRSDATVISLQAELDRINQPHPVSVFCRPATVSTATEGHPAPGTDGSPIGQGAESPLRDIGAAVDAVRREHQSNAAVQRKLMEWEVARTH